MAFIAAANPAAVLELVAENAQLREALGRAYEAHAENARMRAAIHLNTDLNAVRAVLKGQL
jgi:hypothetical protein